MNADADSIDLGGRGESIFLPGSQVMLTLLACEPHFKEQGDQVQHFQCFLHNWYVLVEACWHLCLVN